MKDKGIKLKNPHQAEIFVPIVLHNFGVIIIRINKEQAVIELMNHEEISSSYDKQDIELIIDFEVNG